MPWPGSRVVRSQLLPREGCLAPHARRGCHNRDGHFVYLSIRLFFATIIISSLVALALAYAALRKRSHAPEVVRSYARVGVPEAALDALALTLVAAAAGLLVGLVWVPVGIAAAAGLVVYFVVAVAAHVRANDLRNVATPLVILVLVGSVLLLRLASM